MEAYMTAKEAADYLKLAERTLVRLSHEGKIPGVKIGGQWRFRRALLDEYLDTLAAESVGSGGAAPAQVIDAPFDEIVTVDQIIPDLKAKDRNDVIHAMVAHVTKLGLVQDQAWLEAALAARERLVPTAVPEGVAFLHARHRAADKFPRQFIAVARSKDGLVFGSPDMGATHVFFLLALRNDALHLRWLSRLAWIVRNPGRLARLLDAKNPGEMHATLLDAANNLPASLRPTGRPTQR
ncbi:MAG: PTS sugar transporter subunit IIA [Thermoanaerobaculales bacterium]|jgi:excisionase family DNA binding protein|nr:PTS sugar transporter subunit IIA [Thermoanaerobaculales bacterium]